MNIQWPLIRVCDCEVSIDASPHGGCNDIIGGRRYRYRHNSSSPVSTIPVKNNQKSLKLIAGINGIAEKLFTEVNNTADKFFHLFC
jgi:hypothetical protein